MDLLFKIKNWQQKIKHHYIWFNLQLEHVQQSWVAAITINSKMATLTLAFNIDTGYKYKQSANLQLSMTLVQ